MTWKVEEYIAENGRIPYRDWFDSLHVQAAAKVAIAVLRMEMGKISSVSGSTASANTASTGARATEFI
jgi:hypothetical protein